MTGFVPRPGLLLPSIKDFLSHITIISIYLFCSRSFPPRCEPRFSNVPFSAVRWSWVTAREGNVPNAISRVAATLSVCLSQRRCQSGSPECRATVRVIAINTVRVLNDNQRSLLVRNTRAERLQRVKRMHARISVIIVFCFVARFLARPERLGSALGVCKAATRAAIFRTVSDLATLRFPSSARELKKRSHPELKNTNHEARLPPFEVSLNSVLPRQLKRFLARSAKIYITRVCANRTPRTSSVMTSSS